MPAFSAASKKQLATCHPDLQRLFAKVGEQEDCTVIEGARTQERQDYLFHAGQSKEEWPGSKHDVTTFRPTSMAVDVMPYPVDWSERAKARTARFAGYVLGVAAVLGIKIRWGGDWNQNRDPEDESFFDGAHYEIID